MTRTKQRGPCQVRSKTAHPCPHQAVEEICGVPFCAQCARKQEAYFAMGERTQEPRAHGLHDRLRELGAEEVMSKASSMEEILAAARRLGTKGKLMHSELRVSDMAHAVLSRQARGRAERTGELFNDALVMILQTEAGRQLGELRDGPHRNESAQQWQEDLPHNRAKERSQAQREERSRAFQEKRIRVQLAAWKEFMQAERRELELRKDGQLATLLGATLPGEPPAALRRLASEDRRQAEEELVALTSNGKTSYKHLEELSEGDMPARIAASRLRTTWLKERGDGWLAHGGDDYL